MTVDLATLGVVVDASSADQATSKLDNLVGAGERAENTVNKLKSASAGANAEVNGLANSSSILGPKLAASSQAASDLLAQVFPLSKTIAELNVKLQAAKEFYDAGTISIEEYTAVQKVLQQQLDIANGKQNQFIESVAKGGKTATFTAAEMLNLSRQFTDIGVSAAMGMNPLMILIQQGPQIADVFAQARARGLGFAGALRSVAAAGWAALAPLLPWLLPLVAVIGAVSAGFALMGRSIRNSTGDVTKSMGLTEKQLERVKKSGVDTSVTLGDTFKATFQVLGSRIARALNLDGVKKKFNSLLDTVTNNTGQAVKAMIGLYVGGYSAIIATWRMLPAAIDDLVVSAVNATISAVENLINKVIGGINKLIDGANAAAKKVGLGLSLGTISNVSLGRQDNPNAGMATNAADTARAAFISGRRRGEAAASGLWKDITDKAIKNAQERVAKEAGDPEKDKDKKGGKSAAEQAIEDAKEFIKSLKEETEEIGKNAIEVKKLQVEREKLKITNVGLRKEMDEAYEAWKKATIAEANRQFIENLSDQNKELEFQASLIGKTYEQQARLNAEHQIALEIEKARRNGTPIDESKIADLRASIVGKSGAEGRLKDAAVHAQVLADKLHDVNDALRESVAGFGNLFGTAGEGFENLINVITEFGDKQAEIASRIADIEARRKEMHPEEYEYQMAKAAQERGRIQVQQYGDMLGAAKTFFREGSTGWRIMEGAERAYRLFQFAMAIKAMVLDKTQTASSIANSGARAAADGVAAFAKTLASLPFPFNLVAGAAVLAALVSVGVKIAGGGGHKGASAAASAKATEPGWGGPKDEYGADTSYYSVLKPGAVRVGANDNPGAPVYGGGGGIKTGDINVTINGDVDRNRMAELQQVLDEHRKQTVQETRSVVMNDLAQRQSRQSIGGRG